MTVTANPRPATAKSASKDIWRLAAPRLAPTAQATSAEGPGSFEVQSQAVGSRRGRGGHSAGPGGLEAGGHHWSPPHRRGGSLS